MTALPQRVFRGGPWGRETLKKVLRTLLVGGRNQLVGEGDFILASYPKSGNTLLKKMLAEIVWGELANLDLVEQWIPYVGRRPRELPAMHYTGLLKTHELPSRKYSGGVFLFRDPEEVCASAFRQYLRTAKREMKFAEFRQEFFMRGFRNFGRWDDHLCRWSQKIESEPQKWLVIYYHDLCHHKERYSLELAKRLGALCPSERLPNILAETERGRMQEYERRSSRMRLKSSRPDIPFVGDGEGTRLPIVVGDIKVVLDYRVCDVFSELKRTSREVCCG